MNPSKAVLAPLPESETIDAHALAQDIRSGTITLICVLGPTASGKTRYAVSLAAELANEGIVCEIISADSRQVYRGMDIGTGKDICEYGDVPYHLIDILPAGAQYNVHDFAVDFDAACSSIRERGRFPLLCGGTGLYINAVTSGYDFKGNIPLSESKEFNPGVYFIGTLVSREVRNAKIDARLDARLSEGMVDEIRSLLASGVSAEVLKSYGLEYKFVTQFVLGEISFEEMRLSLATAIHQFAKRQMTWWRGMERAGARIHWTTV